MPTIDLPPQIAQRQQAAARALLGAPQRRAAFPARGGSALVDFALRPMRRCGAGCALCACLGSLFWWHASSEAVAPCTAAAAATPSETARQHQLGSHLITTSASGGDAAGPSPRCALVRTWGAAGSLALGRGGEAARQASRARPLLLHWAATRLRAAARHRASTRPPAAAAAGAGAGAQRAAVPGPWRPACSHGGRGWEWQLPFQASATAFPQPALRGRVTRRAKRSKRGHLDAPLIQSDTAAAFLAPWQQQHRSTCSSSHSSAAAPRPHARPGQQQLCRPGQKHR
jgi:hypothetical protein